MLAGLGIMRNEVCKVIAPTPVFKVSQPLLRRGPSGMERRDVLRIFEHLLCDHHSDGNGHVYG